MSSRLTTKATGLPDVSVVLANSRSRHLRRPALGFFQLVILTALTVPGVAQTVPAPTTLRLSFPVDDLVITQKPFASDPTGGTTLLTSVALRGAGSLRETGKPIVPLVTRRLALPAGARISAVRATAPATSGPVVLEGHQLLEWAQPSQPGQRAGRDPIPPMHDLDDQGEPVFYAVDDSVELDQDVLTAVRWPDPNVWVHDSDEMAGVQVITLKIAPLQWSPSDGRLELATELDVVVEHTGGQWPPPPPQNLTYGEYQDFEWLLTAVANPGDVPGSGGFGDYTLPLPEELDAWYLIITDNKHWNTDKTPGSLINGDVVAEFERLAEWKNQKGVKAAVVTITDIFQGQYGFFNTNARDTQEVLRNFLKHACEEWNTRWVVLGGDVSIIPPRKVVANTTYNKIYFKRVEESKPPESRCYWNAGSNNVRIHHSGYVGTSIKLVSVKTGRVFSKVPTPSFPTPGWNYVQNDSYTSWSNSKTDYIILVGPQADTEETEFYAILDKNTIPTDLYYSSLRAPFYDIPGRHDWDLNDNEVYGQHDGTSQVDGVDYHADLSLGRASVETESEARAFVDKVLAYEKYDDSIPTSFGKRLLLGSANWKGGPAVVHSGVSPPQEGKYENFWLAATARCHFSSSPAEVGDFSTATWDLVAYNDPFDFWYVPYNTNAHIGSPGYWFATDDGYDTISQLVIPIPMIGVLTFPLPTQYVVVRGPDTFIDPERFFFDSKDTDSSVTQKELVKDIFSTYHSGMNIRKRLYEDFVDTPGYPDSDLFGLSQNFMRDQLEIGFNIVSLSGHGWHGGCCGVDSGYVDDLTNGFAGGIVYADSCSTNNFEEDDAVSEEFLTNPTGGAIAYVGNTRWSWIGQGDDIERTFWTVMNIDRRLGIMERSKSVHTDSSWKIWAQFALNMLGDPETSLWVGAPKSILVTHKSCVNPGADLEVNVRDGQGQPFYHATVCLTGPDGFFQVDHTDVAGNATVSAAGAPQFSELVLTVTNTYNLFLNKEQVVPYQATVDVNFCSLSFVRGDGNGDGELDMSDALWILGALFNGTKEILCDDAADVNDDGSLGIADPVKLLAYLFRGDDLPLGTEPGVLEEDPTPDGLGCESYPQGPVR